MADFEKEQHAIGAGSPEYDQSPKAHHRKGSIAVGEAADLYGDVQTAEDYGYVSRGYVHLCPHGIN